MASILGDHSNDQKPPFLVEIQRFGIRLRIGPFQFQAGTLIDRTDSGLDRVFIDVQPTEFLADRVDRQHGRPITRIQQVFR